MTKPWASAPYLIFRSSGQALKKLDVDIMDPLNGRGLYYLMFSNHFQPPKGKTKGVPLLWGLRIYCPLFKDAKSAYEIRIGISLLQIPQNCHKNQHMSETSISPITFFSRWAVNFLHEKFIKSKLRKIWWFNFFSKIVCLILGHRTH